MNKVILVIVALIALVAGSYIMFIGLQDADTQEFEVAQIIDGDTIKLESGQKVRLIGINTPESGHPYYDAATEKLKELIGDSKVTMKKDVEDKDQYGRLLRYIYVNDTFVNLEMVRFGLATSYEFEPNVKYTSDFDVAETQAKSAKIGIWAPSPYTISIGQLVYDAPGDDNDNLNGEYFIFSNQGDASVDMTAWMVLDESNNDYNFPNYFLGNGSTVTLYIGSGTNTENELYWGSTRSIWNNDGDELFLRDEQGLLVVHYKY